MSTNISVLICQEFLKALSNGIWMPRQEGKWQQKHMQMINMVD